MYEIKLTPNFKRNAKKLNSKEIELTMKILNRLANNEILEAKYKDHKLKGSYKGLRECHIKPDLLLIYQKQEKVLILNAINVGSHSELF